MKKRMAALLCALVLLFSLAPTPASAAWDDDFMYLAVNVNLLRPPEFLPLKVDGSIYVPVTVFESSTNGGVRLGVFGSMNTTLNIYTLYDLNSKNLIFDLSTGLSYDYLGGVPQTPKAIIRNGKIYVTAHSVCKYYESTLTYDYIGGAAYGYDLVRIKSRDSALYENSEFINAASSSAMLDVINTYRKSVESQGAVISPAPSPGTQPQEPDREGVKLQLALRCDTGEAGAALLDALAADGRSAALFFSPAQLAAQDDLVRRALGEGHSVGLTVPGDSADAALEAALEGNRLLAHVGRSRTRLLLVDGGAPAVEAALAEEGYYCWSGAIDGVPGERSGYAAAQDILRQAARETRRARVTLDDSTAAATALTRVLRGARQEQYDFRPVVETEF